MLGRLVTACLFQRRRMTVPPADVTKELTGRMPAITSAYRNFKLCVWLLGIFRPAAAERDKPVEMCHSLIQAPATGGQPRRQQRRQRRQHGRDGEGHAEAVAADALVAAASVRATRQSIQATCGIDASLGLERQPGQGVGEHTYESALDIYRTWASASQSKAASAVKVSQDALAQERTCELGCERPRRDGGAEGQEAVIGSEVRQPEHLRNATCPQGRRTR